MALATVGGFLGQAITQDGVTRGVSYMVSRHQERASMDDTYSRLEMAHAQLKFALERSGKLPITDLSLLGQRRTINRVFQECDVLLRSKQPPVRVLLCDDQQARQGVIAAATAAAEEAATGVAAAEVAATATEAAAAAAAAATEVAGEVAEFLCSSFSPIVNIALDAVRSISSSLGINTDDEMSLSRADVQRFERFAEMADRFIRNVESGCSLAHYRFFSPLITQLLQGFTLEYNMVQAGRSQQLWINPVHTEEHGVVALLVFSSFDEKIPAKCFETVVCLQLSEDMDIVGIAIQCVQSLGPQFKSLGQVAIGELSQLPIQDMCVSAYSSETDTCESRLFINEIRPDPLCCEENDVLRRACANNAMSSKRESYRFPEQLLFMGFRCTVSAFDQDNVQSLADKEDTNVVNGWPLLNVLATFAPHYRKGSGEKCAWQTFGEQDEDLDAITSIEQMGEMLLTNAISCFMREPELTAYNMIWQSPHGAAVFVVNKIKEKSAQNQHQVQDVTAQGEQQREA
ncbi:uncharacterized protein LOC100840383 [Brachypodium distachyon]|uniref:Uncharacterized protein n=1 Tax=Brachypodium distachyon TaxID=15368 RepID=I1H465_BRADI|nr:uncharacterized protein LOC100840383 [Brachypodium distachyon]KQK21103.1 hypothetical protein BRADI_1g58720v3 [Brachypodium distachyon]|eukprot:XP_003561477.1 uncharacterized protein LOC100840383 [Brachypodium distachyon]